MRAVALAIVICMSLVSCSGYKISQENFEKIHTGMSMTQVTAILGEPTESSMWPCFPAPFPVGAADVTITIQFVNGKVVAKQLPRVTSKSRGPWETCPLTVFFGKG
jgi:hypothetical protein